MALDDDIAILAEQPLLGLMDRDALRLLAFAADARRFRAGDILFRKDEIADGALLVVAGSVALTPEEDGRPADTIVGAGALIGETALFTSVRRPVTAIAREPTETLRLTRSVMRKVLGESPASAAAIAAAIGERLAIFSDDIARVARRLDAIDGR